MTDAAGYFLHPQGICESENVGEGTRVWAFAHVLPGARIGADCNICDHVFVENDVRVGDRVTVKSGVQLWDGVTLEDDVFVGPNVTFTNDPFPRSRVMPEQFARTLIRRGASLGANCTILPGITVGMHAMVGAGSVVTRDVPPYSIVKGNPARISGYVDLKPGHTSGAETMTAGMAGGDLAVAGARLQRLTQAVDLRGSIVAADLVDRGLPFPPERFFVVYGVPSKDVRGEHAHRQCSQFLVCVAGAVSVVLDDGRVRDEVRLDSPVVGLLIPPMVWGVQYRYTPDALLLVLASRPYEPDDYIRDYDDFLREVAL